MKRRRVVFHDDAKQDLTQLTEWIADRAGVAVALGYAERLQRYCSGFEVFSERGTPRNDLRPGL